MRRYCDGTGDGGRRDRPQFPPSGERALLELEALLDLFDRRSRPAVFVLDVGGNRPPLFLEELENLANRRVALAPRRVVALMALSILHVKIRDVGVMRVDVGHRIEIGGHEMP